MAHAAHTDHDIKSHVRIYYMVFGTLMVLTLVTVGVSYIQMPIVATVTVALIIATFKASLVAMYFMHLKGEVKIVYWSLYLTAIFFVLLFALPMWTEGDHIVGTRSDKWSAGAEGPTMPKQSPAPH